jgi:hypothetical protein
MHRELLGLPENVQDNFLDLIASNWITGDWWVFGKHKYGSRKKRLAEQRARRAQVRSFTAMKMCGSVARAFTTLRRRKLVSFEMRWQAEQVKKGLQTPAPSQLLYFPASLL